jgi:hypothetical protein
MPASLRKNDHPETHSPKFVVAWKQLLLGAPPGHFPNCLAVVARAVAIDGRVDRSGGRSTPRRRTPPPAPREEENRSPLPRRASGRGNPHPNWSGGAETLELVLRFAERPKILDNRSYPRPIVVNAAAALMIDYIPRRGVGMPENVRLGSKRLSIFTRVRILSSEVARDNLGGRTMEQNCS